jgi:hypothetical protein
MANFVAVNFVSTTLANSATNVATTITLTSSAGLPVLSAGQVLPLVLNSVSNPSVYEIVYVSSITGAVLTVMRGQEGTAAVAWSVGDYAFSTATAGVLNNYAFVNGSAAQSFAAEFLSVGGGFTSAVGDIGLGRTASSAVLFFGTSATTQGYVDYGVTHLNAFTLQANNASALADLYALSFRGSGANLTAGTIPLSAMVSTPVDTSTANQVITAPKTIESVFSFTTSAARLVGTGIGTNGFYLTPASDTQSGTMVVTNAAASADLFNFAHVSSTEGRLTVVGQIGIFTGGTYSDPGASSGDMIVQRSNSGGVGFYGGSASSASIDWNVNTSAQLTLRNTGVGYAAITGGTYTTISDESTKTNVKPIESATAMVLALKPVTFDHLNEDKTVGAPGIGFVAQEVETVLPALVTTAEDKKKGVAYHGFAPVLAAAFQELHAEFTAYKAAHP